MRVTTLTLSLVVPILIICGLNLWMTIYHNNGFDKTDILQTFAIPDLKDRRYLF